MDIFKTIEKLIKDDSQEMERIRRAAPNRMDPDRAHRYVQLYNRVDALTDILGHRKRIEEARKLSPKLVVIAGPNDPEVLTLEEIADVLETFETSECWFYTRKQDGTLEPVAADTVDSVRDESFIYYTTTFRALGANGRLVGTCSWSRRRPT